ncbi:hypothetical protein [Streptomyces sp. NPDC020667]|uniref:hypothetical protein n=1 Tax=Streptomyces sp. NPDC020667 TaxID=3154895 RepID=UPI0033E9C606
MAVPRDYSRADLELAARINASPRQIERLREEGCLHPPEQSHPSGVPGSVSVHPPGADDQAKAGRALLEARPLLIAGAKTSFHEVRVRLWWAGHFVEVERVRASYLAVLDVIGLDACSAEAVADAKRFADALFGRAGRRRPVRPWLEALKLANARGRSPASAAQQMKAGLTVLLILLSGGAPGNDEVVDTVDNLGFDLDVTLAARDLAFLNVDTVRAAVANAGGAEMEMARDTLREALRYASTLCYLGSRLDRSLRWPALSLVFKGAVGANLDRLSALVPFVIAIRQQFLAATPDWDESFARHLRQVEAQASVLRAVPKRLHRFIIPSAQAQLRASPRQQQALTAAVGAWAARNPVLAELVNSRPEQNGASVPRPLAEPRGPGAHTDSARSPGRGTTASKVPGMADVVFHVRHSCGHSTYWDDGAFGAMASGYPCLWCGGGTGTAPRPPKGVRVVHPSGSSTGHVRLDKDGCCPKCERPGDLRGAQHMTGDVCCQGTAPTV